METTRGTIQGHIFEKISETSIILKYIIALSACVHGVHDL